MKTSWLSIVGSCSVAIVAASLTACGTADSGDFGVTEASALGPAAGPEELELGQVEEGLMAATCSNTEGTYATMAALAVSAALELKRWQPVKDFLITTNAGAEVLALSPAGISQCVANGTYCINTQALLDFQKDAANGKVQFPGKVLLNSGGLRSRLVARWREQQSCEAQPDNHNASNCPAEQHVLKFQSSTVGGCDRMYSFLATSPTGAALKYPAQLKNKLLWADKANPYIGFTTNGSTVSIDPTYGLNSVGETSTGACTAACVKISNPNVAGQCCSCAGVTKKFTKAAWSANVYLCM
jgi:hypothetical protein